MSGGMTTKEHVCNTSYKQSAPSRHRFFKYTYSLIYLHLEGQSQTWKKLNVIYNNYVLMSVYPQTNDCAFE